MYQTTDRTNNFSENMNDGLTSYSQAQKEQISDFLNSEIKGFKKKLKDQSQTKALNRLLNQLIIGDASYQKKKLTRTNSIQMVISPFREKLAEGMGEDNVLDLLSAPIDSRTILQFYKKSLRTRGQSVGEELQEHEVEADNNNESSALAFRIAKMKMIKTKAAMLLAEKLTSIVGDYFRIFVIRCSPMDTYRNLSANRITTRREIILDENLPLNLRRIKKAIDEAKELSFRGMVSSRNQISSARGQLSPNFCIPSLRPRAYSHSNHASLPNSPHGDEERTKENSLTVEKLPINSPRIQSQRFKANYKNSEDASTSTRPTPYRHSEERSLNLNNRGRIYSLYSPNYYSSAENTTSFRGNVENNYDRYTTRLNNQQEAAHQPSQEARTERTMRFKSTDFNPGRNEAKTTFLKDLTQQQSKRSKESDLKYLLETELIQPESKKFNNALKKRGFNIDDIFKPQELSENSLSQNSFAHNDSTHRDKKTLVFAGKILEQELIVPQEKASTRNESAFQSRLESLAKRVKASQSVEPKVKTTRRTESPDLNLLKGTLSTLRGIGQPDFSTKRKENDLSNLSFDFIRKNPNEVQTKSSLKGSNLSLGFELKRNLYSQEDSKSQNTVKKLQPSLAQKVEALSKLVHILRSVTGPHDAFKRLKTIYQEFPAIRGNSFSRSMDSTMSKTIGFQTFNELPPATNDELGLGLYKITESETPEMTHRNKNSQSQSSSLRPSSHDSNQTQRSQGKIISLLLLERACSQLLRKVYSACFEQISTAQSVPRKEEISIQDKNLEFNVSKFKQNERRNLSTLFSAQDYFINSDSLEESNTSISKESNNRTNKLESTGECNVITGLSGIESDQNKRVFEKVSQSSEENTTTQTQVQTIFESQESPISEKKAENNLRINQLRENLKMLKAEVSLQLEGKKQSLEILNERVAKASDSYQEIKPKLEEVIDFVPRNERVEDVLVNQESLIEKAYKVSNSSYRGEVRGEKISDLASKDSLKGSLIVNKSLKSSSASQGDKSLSQNLSVCSVADQRAEEVLKTPQGILFIEKIGKISDSIQKVEEHIENVSSAIIDKQDGERFIDKPLIAEKTEKACVSSSGAQTNLESTFDVVTGNKANIVEKVTQNKTSPESVERNSNLLKEVELRQDGHPSYHVESRKLEGMIINKESGIEREEKDARQSEENQSKLGKPNDFVIQKNEIFDIFTKKEVAIEKANKSLKPSEETQVESGKIHTFVSQKNEIFDIFANKETATEKVEKASNSSPEVAPKLENTFDFANKHREIDDTMTTRDSVFGREDKTFESQRDNGSRSEQVYALASKSERVEEMSLQNKQDVVHVKKSYNNNEFTIREIKKEEAKVLETDREQNLERKVISNFGQDFAHKLTEQVQQVVPGHLNDDLKAKSCIIIENSIEKSLQAYETIHFANSLKPEPSVKNSEEIIRAKSAEIAQTKQNKQETPFYEVKPAGSSPRFITFGSPLESSMKGRNSPNQNNKVYENTSGLNEHSRISKQEDYPSFTYDSPVKGTTAFDDSYIVSSTGRRFKDLLYYSPIKKEGDISPNIHYGGENKNSFFTPQTRSPIKGGYIYEDEEASERTLSDFMIQTIIEDKSRLFGIAFKKGAAEVKKKLYLFYLMDRVVKKNRRDNLWYAFNRLGKGAQSPSANYSVHNVRVNHFMESNRSYQNKSLSPFTVFGTNTQRESETYYTTRQNKDLEVFHLSNSSQESPERKTMSSRFEAQKFDISREDIQILMTPYKQKLLNSMVFAKKIEKLYNFRLRAGFTRLCFQFVGVRKQKELEFKNFLKKLELNIKRTYFIELKSHAANVFNTQNKLVKLFSLINKKKLRLLSEAFRTTARSGLVKKEYLLHLTLFSIKLSEIKKPTMRRAFNSLKQNSEQSLIKAQDKTFFLEKLFKEANSRQYYALKSSFLKWRGLSINFSVSCLNEAAKISQDNVTKAYLSSTLRSVFNSRMQMNKFHAFYKLKHHTKNLEGVSSLYTVLEQKQWNRLRVGFENILSFQKEASKGQDLKLTKLERVSEIFKAQLNNSFIKIFICSQTLRESKPQAKRDQRNGLARLSVIAEELKLRMLSHGFKMIELLDIHKRNQKNSGKLEDKLFQEKLESCTRKQIGKYFAGWKLALHKNVQEKAQLQTAFAKIEELSHVTLMSQYASAFRMLKNHQKQTEHVPLILKLSISDQSPSANKINLAKKLNRGKSSTQKSSESVSKKSGSKTSYGLVSPKASSSAKKSSTKINLASVPTSPISLPSKPISPITKEISKSPSSAGQVSNNVTIKVSTPSNFSKLSKK